MLIKDQLYALQVLEYEPGRFLKWIWRNPFRSNLEKKKKLVFTNKAKILLLISTLIPLLLITVLASLFTTPTKTPTLFLIPAAVVSITYLVTPWLYLTMTLFVIKIYEIPNKNKTIMEAAKILSEKPHLITIGITGSYGKTTVKEVLKTVLSKKYKVLSTPKSFNTLFGISHVIKEQLRPEHEVFIVEMGAYKKGEIAQLCRMIKPKIGILTGITNQHLERFGSEENIIRAKYELIESLPGDGLAVFNLDSFLCQRLYSQTKLPKIGYSIHSPQSDIYAANITESEDLTAEFKMTFDLKVNSSLLYSDEVIGSIALNLPGRHNVGNTLAAVAVARYLDVSIPLIIQALSEVTTPEHRLQILRRPDNTIIIDDAYSSNPEGARAAVNLVGKFSNKPKIIVTPGLVELGKRQFDENRQFGKDIARSFDYAVIANKTNREALLRGLLDGGWLFLKHTLVEHLGFTPSQLENYNVPEELEERVFVTDTLDQAAHEIIPNLVKSGCLILFENDLPDIYG